VGSTYSSSFSIANGLGTGATGLAGTVGLATTTAAGADAAAGTGARSIRIANTVQYSSPVFNGFSAHIGITPQNNNVTGTTTSSLSVGNTVGVKEYALRYTNGPIDAMYTNIKYEVGSAGTAQNRFTAAGVASTGVVTGTGSVTTPSTLAANLSSTQSLLGATYTVMPTLKVHAGFGNFSSSNNLSKGKSTQFGVTYTMGNIDLMAQMAKVDDTSTTNTDRKMTGIGVNYNLSKTARVYLRADDINYSSNGVAFTGSTLKRTAVGISKSF